LINNNRNIKNYKNNIRDKSGDKEKEEEKQIARDQEILKLKSD
jgi:hypothetical protein